MPKSGSLTALCQSLSEFRVAHTGHIVGSEFDTQDISVMPSTADGHTVVMQPQLDQVDLFHFPVCDRFAVGDP